MYGGSQLRSPAVSKVDFDYLSPRESEIIDIGVFLSTGNITCADLNMVLMLERSDPACHYNIVSVRLTNVVTPRVITVESVTSCNVMDWLGNTLL